ncbi:hypothetical protein F5887DRAFT_313560 [Amanita rubescens]|nr:hypothetical protein F5887DRAFT_313560 [Amanita rubescens]
MMATRLRKRIRCRLPLQYFDDNGDPTRTRCKNTVDTCDFVHPSEAEWDDLPPYHRAPRRSTFDGAPDRVRRRSRSPTLLGRMTRRSRSRSPRRYNPSHRSALRLFASLHFHPLCLALRPHHLELGLARMTLCPINYVILVLVPIPLLPLLASTWSETKG